MLLSPPVEKRHVSQMQRRAASVAARTRPATGAPSRARAYSSGSGGGQPRHLLWMEALAARRVDCQHGQPPLGSWHVMCTGRMMHHGIYIFVRSNETALPAPPLRAFRRSTRLRCGESLGLFGSDMSPKSSRRRQRGAECEMVGTDGPGLRWLHCGRGQGDGGLCESTATSAGRKSSKRGGDRAQRHVIVEGRDGNVLDSAVVFGCRRCSTASEGGFLGCSRRWWIG